MKTTDEKPDEPSREEAVMAFFDRKVNCCRCGVDIPPGERLIHSWVTRGWFHLHDCMAPELTVIEGEYQDQMELEFRPDLKVIR